MEGIQDTAGRSIYRADILWLNWFISVYDAFRETDGLTVYFSAALGSTPCHILSGTMNMAYLSPMFALNFGEKVISSSIYTEGSWP